MVCLNCRFYDKNDQINAFGTCEPQDKDYHCTHECHLAEDEIREVEGLTGHRRQGSRNLEGKYMDEKGKNLRNHISNEAGMLEGCKNRMCVTDDANELAQLYVALNQYAANLFNVNLKRIRDT